MTISLQTINNFKVIPRPIVKDNRPVQASFMFPICFCVTYLLGKKHSGKTVVIDNILQKRIGPNTTVVIFSSTLEADDAWIALTEWLEKKEIPHVLHDSIYDDHGNNLLKELIVQLKMETAARKSAEKKEREDKKKKQQKGIKFYDHEEPEEKAKKPKFLAPDWLIVIDDLSDEVHDKSLETLIKKHRHFRSQILISNQTLNDVTLSARKQLDYWILFNDIDDLKLQEIYERTSQKVSLEDFCRMYKFATKEQYNFFYFATSAIADYRVNFNQRFNVNSNNFNANDNIPRKQKKYLR